MRALKFLAAVALPLMLTLALGISHKHAIVWAQLPPPNPLVVPQAAPSAPAQLSPPVPPQGLPSLAVVPSPPVAAVATPSARVFNCSCFGAATGTRWMGLVTASGYFGARQAATGACLSYQQEKAPEAPFVPPRSPAAVAPVPLTGFQAPGAATTSPALAGTLNFSTAQQLRNCSQCTCD
jgi:hypothetical protein